MGHGSWGHGSWGHGWPRSSAVHGRRRDHLLHSAIRNVLCYEGRNERHQLLYEWPRIVLMYHNIHRNQFHRFEYSLYVYAQRNYHRRLQLSTGNIKLRYQATRRDLSTNATVLRGRPNVRLQVSKRPFQRIFLPRKYLILLRLRGTQYHYPSIPHVPSTTATNVQAFQATFPTRHNRRNNANLIMRFPK